MKNFMKDFKAFIARGNVIDMAVGVVIGGAFGKIVTSLVENIIMPIVGIIIGGHDFTSLSITIKNATIEYGVFIQNIVDFLIISFCIFTVIRVIGSGYRKKAKKEEKEAKEEKPADIVLLEEIRDLLKNEKKAKSK